MTGELSDDCTMYFDYGQLIVFDDAEEITGLDWTEVHSEQGFARRESTVSFATLLQFGNATVRVRLGRYEQDSTYERVVAVPFLVRSGTVGIAAPAERGGARIVPLSRGPYRLYCAQRVSKDDDLHGEEVIDLYFEVLDRPAEHSDVIVADADLHPPEQLVEDAELAGE